MTTTPSSIDINVTPESIERNFILIKKILADQATEINNNASDLFTKYQSRIDAINATIAKIDSLIDQRISLVNNFVCDTSASFNELVSKTVDDTNKTINDAVSKLEQEKVSGVDFNEKVNKLVQVDGENKALIDQTATGVSTIVGNLNNDPSSSPYKSISVLKETADQISQTVATNKTDADGKVENAMSSISQKADQINAIITELGEDPSLCSYAAIQMLKTAINLVVSNLNSTSGDSTYTSIAALQILANKIEAAVSTKAEAADLTIQSNKISSIVTELGKTPENCAYSAITQLKNAIDLKVSGTDFTGAEMVARLNLSPDGIKLVGKLIDVEGDMIVPGTITADKLKVSSLSAVCTTVGLLRTAVTGARTEISDNLICVYDSNNVLRVRMGVW
jgi:hypothetical protein